MGHRILYILAYQELKCLGVEIMTHLFTVITTKMALLILHHIVGHHISLPGTPNVGTPWCWNTDTSPIHCHHIDDTAYVSGGHDCLSQISFLFSPPLINWINDHIELPGPLLNTVLTLLRASNHFK